MSGNDNLEDLKQKIYQQIQEILMNDELEDQEKIDILDQAYAILAE